MNGGQSSGNIRVSLFIGLTAALFAFLTGSSTIFVGDTDLWYHLSSGRYFAGHFSPPSSSAHFSYLEPVRAYTDYYWLFQYIVYEIHRLFGYEGLTLFRAAATFSIVLIFGAMLKTGDEEKDPWKFAAFGTLFLTSAFLVKSRMLNIRPHMSHYIALALFIYILEKKREKAWLLPVIALFWMNLHGVNYPILFIVTMSYFAEIAARRLFSGKGEVGEDTRTALWMLVSLAMIWVNPAGSKLIGVPFMMTGNATHYIAELKNFEWPVLLNVHFINFVPMGYTATAILLVVDLYCAFSCLKKGTLRISHLLLLAGAFFLLAKSGRFYVEMGILGLPLTGVWLAGIKPRENAVFRKRTYALLALLLILPVSWQIREGLINRHKFPYSPNGLPEGIAEFLIKKGGGGKIFHHPDSGGFLQWRLYPDYKIFMDMEIPFLFKDEDMYQVASFLSGQGDFQGFIKAYRPEFVIAENSGEAIYAYLKKNAEYRPVFFDDYGILYANKELKPALVEEYELKAVSPREHASDNFRGLSGKAGAEETLKELKKVNGVWPGGGVTNRWIAQALLAEGKTGEAYDAAQRCMDDYPQNAISYLLAGEVLREAKKYDESLAMLMKTYGEMTAKEKILADISAGYTYKAMGDAENAYKHFARGINTFGFTATAEDIWQFSLAAFLTGREKEAAELARYAEARLKPGETESRKRMLDVMNKLGVEPLGKRVTPSSP